MNETCNPNDCPVSARVGALEKEFDRYRGSSSDTHRQMFDRIGALEQSGATLKAKLDGMDDKLDGNVWEPGVSGWTEASASDRLREGL